MLNVPTSKSVKSVLDKYNKQDKNSKENIKNIKNIKNNGKKVILILCDGLKADIALSEMGYLNLACSGNKKKIVADLPSISRTNYESLHTGTPSHIHGVTSNIIQRKSLMKNNIFAYLTKNGKSTACVGSSWFYDLYGKDDFSFFTKKETEPNDKDNITYGRFYADNGVENNINIDSKETLATANFLITKYLPDYVLIHILTPDNMGHTTGIDDNYYKEVHLIDEILGAAIPLWIQQNYSIIVTSDHGMSDHKTHGGINKEVVETPLFLINFSFLGETGLKRINKITDIAPLIIKTILPEDNNFVKNINKYK